MAGGITGKVAEIRWHTYVAAGIHGWSVAKTNGQWHLRAIVGLSDGFKMTQRPLTFVAKVKRRVPPPQTDWRRQLSLPESAWTLEDRVWRWPIESFTLADGALIAQLGPPLP